MRAYEAADRCAACSDAGPGDSVEGLRHDADDAAQGALDAHPGGRRVDGSWDLRECMATRARLDLFRDSVEQAGGLAAWRPVRDVVSDATVVAEGAATGRRRP